MIAVLSVRMKGVDPVIGDQQAIERAPTNVPARQVRISACGKFSLPFIRMAHITAAMR